MSIQIKEIIASDTISGLVEKLNYNFDQILLNGGGPRGPQGTIGAKGNIGDRGIRGNIWIVQDVAPDLNNDDYIPGDKLVLGTGEIKTVVEVNSVKTWESTNVNIKGKTGDKGDNDVVDYITHGANTKQIVHFKKYEYIDVNSTPTSISTVLIGGASSGTGDGLASQYIVPDSLLSGTSITNTSLLIHSNGVDSKAIVFTGRSAGSITHTEKLNEAAYIRLDDDDSILINSGANEDSSITLGKNNGSKIKISKDDLTISHNSTININRGIWSIVKIDSENAAISSSASSESGSLVLDAKKIGVLAKELQLNAERNYIRIGEGAANKGVVVGAHKGNIDINAFDATENKGKITMLGMSDITLGGVDIVNGGMSIISAIQIIKDYNELKNKITLKSNEIKLSTSSYKAINDNNVELDNYIHIKNGDYALDSKGIDLVTNSGHLNLVNNTTKCGSIILRNGEANINNAITLDRRDGNNYVLIAGGVANKPGLLLDNANNNVQLIGKTIWNDGLSFINANDLPDLKSVHIRKNDASSNPNLILSTDTANTYSSSRLLYGYQGNTATGHTTTMQSITVNPGSIKLSYGPGNQHYNDQIGHNQGFVIRSFEYPTATNPGFKIIDGIGEHNVPLSIDKNGIYSEGNLKIIGDSELVGNCNVGGGTDITAKLTARNTALPGILYSCRLKYKQDSNEITHSHIWGPIADKTSTTSQTFVFNISQLDLYHHKIYYGSNYITSSTSSYAICFGVANAMEPGEYKTYNGIVISLFKKIYNRNGSYSYTKIDLDNDFTVQVTPIKDDIHNVFHADYIYYSGSIIVYTYKWNGDDKIQVYANTAVNITIIGPIVTLDENGHDLWDFRY